MLQDEKSTTLLLDIKVLMSILFPGFALAGVKIPSIEKVKVWPPLTELVNADDNKIE
jgi:hypothetical protein